MPSLLLLVMRLDGLAGDLLLLPCLLMIIGNCMPSLWMRLVARLHGCSPALTTSLVKACDHEVSFPIRSWQDWKTSGTRRLTFKELQFRCILEERK